MLEENCCFILKDFQSEGKNIQKIKNKKMIFFFAISYSCSDVIPFFV